MAELKHDITPGNAPRFAADVVALVEEFEGVTLDYSVESLEVIDRILGRFHEEGVEFEEVEATCFSFGCYVGEVFVRNAGATWRMAGRQEEEEVFGAPLVLQMGPDRTVNPIGKVIKRLESGEEDNLPYFYRKLARRSGMPHDPELPEEAERDYDALLERMMPLVEKWLEQRDGFTPCGASITTDGEIVGQMVGAFDMTTESAVRMLFTGLQTRARAGEIRATCVCFDGGLDEDGEVVPAIVVLLEHVRGPATIIHRPYRKNPDGTYDYARMEAQRFEPEVFPGL